MEFNPQPDTI